MNLMSNTSSSTFDGGGGGRVYIQGSTRDFYALQIEHDSLHLSAIGEPSGTDLLAVLHKAISSGSIVNHRNTIVDLSQFRGALDWQAVRVARAMMGWEEEGHRVAYVVMDEATAKWTKPLATSFEKTKIDTFGSFEEAQTWLNGD